MENKSLLVHIIYFLIDTTPRQKFLMIVKVLKYLLFSTSKNVFNLFLNYKSFAAKTVYASIVLHFLALGAVLGFDNLVDAVIKDNTISASNEDLTPEQVELHKQQQQEYIEITGVYYISPEDLYSKKKKILKKAKPVNSILEKLKNNKASWRVNSKTVNTIDTSKPSSFKKVVGKKPVLKSNWRDVVTEQKVTQGLSQAAIEKELNKHLLKYNNRFKSCYETVLLNDTSLNAKVSFLLKVGQNRNVVSSKININGVGLPESKSQLRSCLTKITNSIRFPSKSQKIAGQKIKFQVVLNSWD